MSRQSATTKEVVTSLPEEIWSMTQVMRFLQSSRTAVYDLMKNDGLPYVQLGRHRRFDPRDVAAWWERKRRRQIA